MGSEPTQNPFEGAQISPFKVDANILIVEDSGLQAKAFAKTLRDLGCTHIQCCHKASAALDAIRNHACDIVFCDWNMPERSGLELLQDVRADPTLQKLPFIMVTAHAEKDKVISALENGVTDYIVKPVNETLIKEKLTKHLT